MSSAWLWPWVGERRLTLKFQFSCLYWFLARGRLAAYILLHLDPERVRFLKEGRGGVGGYR